MAMAQRYRKQYDEDENLNEDDEDSPQGVSPVGEELSGEEKSYKKRYGDLRTGSQRALSERDTRIADLEAKLAEAAKTSVKYPKTEDEVKTWMTKFPDVAGIVETIVLQKINESSGPTSNRVKELEEEINRSKTERAKEKALKKILEAHPDFNEIVDEAEKLAAWVDTQAQWVHYALYENETDAQSVIDAVDLYKSRNKGASRAKEREDQRNAALGVNRNGGGAPRERTKGKFSESQVEAMSSRDYEKYSDEIDEARRTGNFIYDLTGE